MRTSITYFLLIFIISASSAQEVIQTGKNYRVDSAAVANGAVYTFVEQNPEYVGGDAELIKFIQRNLQYPQMEKDNHIQGKVLLRFIVEPDGSVTNAQVVKSISRGLDKEAIRVAKFLHFIPGRQQGKAVKVYFNLPIEFKL